MVLKCAKNMHESGRFQVSQIPSLGNKVLCPVRALKKVVTPNPSFANKPFFVGEGGGAIFPAYLVRKVLKRALIVLGLETSGLGFHSLSRSGACWAFDHGIPLSHIKVHGNWRSEAIWKYVVSTPGAAGQVAKAFKRYI